MASAVIVQKNPAISWKLPFSASEFSVLLSAMLDEAGHGDAAVELALVDDTAMERLNRESMGCAGPTNILSFPASAMPIGCETPSMTVCRPDIAIAHGASAMGEEDWPFLGWMALSADTLSRECFLYGQEEEEHNIRLLAHGLCHLMGHEHGPAMDALTERLEAAAHDALRRRQAP